MKLSTSSILVVLGAASTRAAFVPNLASPAHARSRTVVRGYLDDLSKELGTPSEEVNPEMDTHEARKMKDEDKDRFGPGQWKDYVEFNEFDGGDGQMGVAGDGQKGLDKIGTTEQLGSTFTKNIAKSQAMSAKNAWGTSTGYADELLKSNPKMDVARAQQLENWQNQQEILRKKQAQRDLEESFNRVETAADEDWRTLAKFGVERNQEFDMDEAFGAVVPGDQIDGTIQLTSMLNRITIHEMALKNEYMGFADFRAAFTPETSNEWTVEPREGSCSSKEATNFIVRFRPQNPGVSEGYLVIETEDWKKTFKLIGSTG